MFRNLSLLLFKQLYYEIPIQIIKLNLHVMDASVSFGGKRRGWQIPSISENVVALIHIIDKILSFLRY
jgi:hypothetical protein